MRLGGFPAIGDIGHFCIYFSVNCPLTSFAHFSIGLFFLIDLCELREAGEMGLPHLSATDVANMFSQIFICL